MSGAGRPMDGAAPPPQGGAGRGAVSGREPAGAAQPPAGPGPAAGGGGSAAGGGSSAAGAPDAPAAGPVHGGPPGPGHAAAPALLRIFDEPCATHRPMRRPAPGGHRLFLAVPRAAAPAGGWPILYLLDGNAAFDYLTPAHLAQAPGLVLAGVGYDTDRQFARERRTLDFTPPDAGPGPLRLDRPPHAPGEASGPGGAPPGAGDGVRPDPAHPGRMAGGAARFLDRLTGPLRAEAEAGLAVDPARRTLWGHSFGGLLVLYALLARPGAFARHAAISPSLWWDAPLMARIAAAAPRGARPLLVALGDREKRSGSAGPPPDGPAPATLGFLADLARHPGIAAELHVLAGLKHIETLPASLPLALPFAAR